MTIEIRQMMIKSNIDNGTARQAKKNAGKPSPADDGCEDCGDCDGSMGGSEERRQMRSMLAMEFERMRER